MRSALRLFFILSFLMLMTMPVVSQVPLPSKGTNKSQNTQSQRQVDEQLARSFYNNKEYDKAADLYLKLYNNYNNFNLFNIRLFSYVNIYGRVNGTAYFNTVNNIFTNVDVVFNNVTIVY